MPTTMPSNLNLLSQNAGLSNGKGPSYPLYLNAAPTSSTYTSVVGFMQPGQVVIVIGVGAWILLSLTNVAGVYTASWQQIAGASGLTLAGPLTVTSGDITATNGNIVRGTAGNKDVYSSVATTTAAGANSAGTVSLVSGQAVVATTAVTANSQIRLYRQGIGTTGAAALGFVTLLTKVAGTSFTIRAVQPADATAAQTTDASVIGWEIVN